MNAKRPAPQSQRPALPPGAMRWLFFGASGRIGRTLFVLGWLFLSAINAGLLTLMVARAETGQGAETVALLAVTIALATIWPSAMLTVKRLHDIDLAGAFAILIFVPALSIILLIALSFLAGTRGPNNFGDLPDAPQS